MKIKNSNQQASTTICECLVFVLMLYLTWYKEIWGTKAVILYGVTTILTCIALLKCFNEKMPLNNMPTILVAYFLLAMFSFTTGWIVAKDLSAMLSSIFTFLSFFVVCFDVWIISEEKGSMDWILQMFTVCALVCSLQTVIWGSDFNNGIIVRTMSPTNNPNTLGFIMLCGTFSIIAKLEKLEKHRMLGMILIMLFLFTIVLSGSRKCFLAAVLLVVLWIVHFVKSGDSADKTKKLKNLIYVLIFAAVVIFFAVNYLSGTSLFERLKQLFAKGGGDERIRLYKDGIKFWKNSPLIGVGFDQYKYWSTLHMYSHSTYIELLSCTGIIGCLIFFFPFMRYVSRRNLSQTCKDDCNKIYEYRICMAMLLVELFMGLGQIFIYSLNHMIILLYLFYENRRLNRC